MKEAVNEIAKIACAAGPDLMRPTEAEPNPGEPRDPVRGFQPDELYAQLEAVAEWGSRGWNRVLDWQDRERKLGPCLQQLSVPSVTQ